MALDADRRAQLERARAVALLRQCFDISASSTPAAAPFGITVRSEEQAWIVSMSDDLAALGGVLVWLDRLGASKTNDEFLREVAKSASAS